MKSLTIIGAGGHAKVVAEAVRLRGEYDLICFINEVPESPSVFLEHEVLHSLDQLSTDYFVVAIGDNKIRQEKFAAAIAKGALPAIIIHPDAFISPSAVIGNGCTICVRAAIGPETRLGDNVIVNTAVTIDHDCQVGSHSHVAVGAHVTGGCSIGQGALLGAGAILTPRVSVGAWSTVGAGAVVLADIAPGQTAVGVPAKVI